jgi:hypothetical protein
MLLWKLIPSHAMTSTRIRFQTKPYIPDEKSEAKDHGIHPSEDTLQKANKILVQEILLPNNPYRYGSRKRDAVLGERRS